MLMKIKWFMSISYSYDSLLYLAFFMALYKTYMQYIHKVC